jgi:hypothetical protein
MLILQNCVDIVRDEHGSCTEMYPTSSGDGKQFVFVNIDDVTHIKQEDDPELTTSTVIKTEPAVSCMSLWVRCSVYYTDIECFLSVHLSKSNIWTAVTGFSTLLIKTSQEYCIGQHIACKMYLPVCYKGALECIKFNTKKV